MFYFGPQLEGTGRNSLDKNYKTRELPYSRPMIINVRESLIEEKLKKESEENEKSKKELVALNKKLCQKQNEILKLKTDFQKMKRRNGILEEENILRKRPEDKSTEKKNEVRIFFFAMAPFLAFFDRIDPNQLFNFMLRTRT